MRVNNNNGNQSSGGSDEYSLVVVGSGGVGKSCLTVRFLKDEFTADYDPTIEESYRKTVNIDERSCVLNIVDTAGQQEYTALRDQHLSSGNAFLLVFSLLDKATLNEALALRKSILNLKADEGIKNVPFVLAGNKCDVPAGERDVQPADIEAALASANAKNNLPFVETSAKDNIGVREAFEILVREARKMAGNGNGGSGSKNKNGKKSGKCVIF